MKRSSSEIFDFELSAGHLNGDIQLACGSSGKDGNVSRIKCGVNDIWGGSRGFNKTTGTGG